MDIEFNHETRGKCKMMILTSEMPRSKGKQAMSERTKAVVIMI